jgi:hypothetical protein
MMSRMAGKSLFAASYTITFKKVVYSLRSICANMKPAQIATWEKK